MKNKKNLQKYFDNKYYNKSNNYKAVLSEIRKDEYMNKSRFFKMISTAILTLLGMTSIVFASTKIYNEYIKVQDTVQSTRIWDNGTGITNYETDLTQNDMIYNMDSRLYHKIITNMEDYNKYKERINELPEMSEESFNENFLVVVASNINRKIEDRDLTIVDIFADEKTTHIILKQKENPDYDNCDNIWYAVVDNSQLRKNIETELEYEYIKNPEFVSLSDLPEDYSIEDALKDGCFVVNDYENKVLSDNIYEADEFIKKAENNETVFMRIYSKYNDTIRIADVEYKDGIFTINSLDRENNKIHVGKYRYFMKGYKRDNNFVRYYLTNDNVDIYGTGGWSGMPIISIYQE